MLFLHMIQKLKTFVVPDENWISGSQLPITDDGVYNLALPREFPFSLKYFSFTALCNSVPNNHDFFELFYVYSGSGIYFTENKEYRISAGDVLLVSASLMHHINTSKEDLKIISLAFLPDLIYHPSSHDIDFGYLLPFYYSGDKINHLIPSGNETAKEIIRLIQSIHSESIDKKRFFRQAAKTYVSNILLLLLQYYDKQLTDISQIIKDIYQFRRLKEVFDYIRDNYADPIRLSDLAEKANLSSVYLCKYFKKVAGCTLTDYILNYRINCAKKLLLFSQLPVSEIAYSVGFSSPSYFNRIFLRIAKTAPVQYRKKYAGGKEMGN
jgi:AraC-like DNA-binding protein/mannose-6-phosphate isomerase-like protein (cupin superfamily)